MEIVLGVSMTPTTVRMVLVESEKADGVIIDHDVFDIITDDGSATPNASDQVIAAVLGTREGALAAGHHLAATGVAWSDPVEAAALREALSVADVEDVMLFSELHAAGALVHAIGRAVGYDTVALVFVERETATLAVVQTVDGSIINAVSCGLQRADEIAVLTELVSGLESHEPRPDGMFVVGAGVDATSLKSHLEKLVAMPVHTPAEPELALARAAALAAANAPSIEASTVALAYSREPDEGTTAAAAFPDDAEKGRKPFLLAGSALTTIFGVGVVTLVVSLAVNIQPTVDQRPSPGENAIHPNTLAPTPPAVQNVQPHEARPAPQTVPAEPPAGPPPIPPQEALPGVTLQEVAPALTVLPSPAAPVAPPVAPPALFGPSPVIAPAPVIQLPVPWLPPILLTPVARPPWYPVPQQPQWRPPRHGHDGGKRGGD